MDIYEYFGIERIPIEEIIEAESKGKDTMPDIWGAFADSRFREAYRTIDAVLNRYESGPEEQIDVEPGSELSNFLMTLTLIKYYSAASVYTTKGRHRKAEDYLSDIETILRKFAEHLPEETTSFIEGCAKKLKSYINERKEKTTGIEKSLDDLDKDLAAADMFGYNTAKMLGYDVPQIKAEIDRLERQQKEQDIENNPIIKSVTKNYKDRKDAEINILLQKENGDYSIVIYDATEGNASEQKQNLHKNPVKEMSIMEMIGMIEEGMVILGREGYNVRYVSDNK